METMLYGVFGDYTKDFVCRAQFTLWKNISPDEIASLKSMNEVFAITKCETQLYVYIALSPILVSTLQDAVKLIALKYDIFRRLDNNAILWVKPLRYPPESSSIFHKYNIKATFLS